MNPTETAVEPRNTSPAPRIERVHIVTSDNEAVEPGRYDSLADVDAMLERAFAQSPPPDGAPYHMLAFVIVWSDGFELSDRVYVSSRLVRDAASDGGLLRHALLRMGRARASEATYKGWHPDLVARHTAEGRAFLRRIEADADEHEDRRNGSPSTWRAPSLLPDPAAAISRLRARFADRRKVLRAVGQWDAAEGAYPATNHADVRYVTNYVSIALKNDLRALDAAVAERSWEYWRSVVAHVDATLGLGRDTDRYADNLGFWTRQLPALVALLDGSRRNGRLTFRPVGARGDPYPPWVQDLRGRSGVYVIRAPGDRGGSEVVYVGSSSADRLHEKLTRHFQAWRRYKGFWRGQFGEGHDPGLTYERDTAEAVVIVTPPQHALALESRLIRRLRPRDNLIGQGEDHVPF